MAGSSTRGEGCLWPSGEELAWRLRGAGDWGGWATSMGVSSEVVLAANVSGGTSCDMGVGVLGLVVAAEDAAEKEGLPVLTVGRGGPERTVEMVRGVESEPSE